MAQIRIDLAEPLIDGMDIKFKAPCDCTAITGMVVHYPAEDDSTANKSFVFKDTHGNILTGLGNLFVKDAYVKVIVDTTNGIAYLQNADTNGYLEDRLAEKMDNTIDAASRVLISDANGKVATSNVTSTELGYLDGVTGYVQAQLDTKANKDSYLPLSGGAMAGKVTLNGIHLTENVDYGPSFPTDASNGRLYFKKVSS